MKAEHRKELETNVLADRMGRMVESMKHRPQGRSLFWIVFAVVIVAALFFTYRFRVMAQQKLMEEWKAVEIGDPKDLAVLSGIEQTKQRNGAVKLSLAGTADTTNAGKAARFQMARFFLWDQGIRVIGSPETDDDKVGVRDRALGNIRFAEEIYNALQKDCEGELEFEAEAHYALAVIDETRALQNQKHLASAQSQFETIAEKFKDSGFAPLAEKRARELRENRDSIAKLYRDLQTKLGFPEEEENKLPAAFR
jgi:hypothetical protein